jgi:E-phenylitaconyl-CoA hydratase
MERAAILFDVADNVATITLNRPDSLNSFNNDMAADMQWAWETVRDTDDIHCVVLQANGDRAFCTGVDIHSGDLWFMKDNDFNSFDPGETL